MVLIIARIFTDLKQTHPRHEAPVLRTRWKYLKQCKQRSQPRSPGNENAHDKWWYV
jgi:hypothetical protein